MFAFNNDSTFKQIISLVVLVLLGLVAAMSVGALFGLIFYGSGILDSLQSGVYSSPDEISFLKLFQGISHFGMFMLPAFVYAWLSGINKYNYLRISSFPVSRLVILTVLLLVFILPVVGLTVEWNSNLSLPEFMQPIENWMRSTEESATLLTEKLLSDSSFTALLVNLFIMAVLPAFGEEFIFRGVLIRIFGKVIKNIHINIFIVALIFSALHLQFFGFLPRFILGVVLGYLLYWSGSLWLPIIFHFLFNGTTVVVFYLSANGIINADPDKVGTLENPFLVILPLAVVVVIMFWFQKFRPSNALADN